MRVLRGLWGGGDYGFGVASSCSLPSVYVQGGQFGSQGSIGRIRGTGTEFLPSVALDGDFFYCVPRPASGIVINKNIVHIGGPTLVFSPARLKRL